MTPDPPEPRVERRKDAWTRERITEVLQVSIEDRRHLHRHLKWVERAVAIFGLVIIATAAATGALIGANSDRLHQINAERARNVRSFCVDQNMRHDRTVRTLDAEIKAAALLRPRQAAQIRESRQFTIALLNSIAPHRDCGRLVASQVSSAREK